MRWTSATARRAARNLMGRIRRMFNRAELDANEVNILRGILTAVQNRRRKAGDEQLRRERRRRSIWTTPPRRRWMPRVARAHGRGAGDAARATRPPTMPAGRAAQALIEAARAQVAALVGAAARRHRVHLRRHRIEQPRHHRHCACGTGARRQAACDHAGHRAQVGAGDRCARWKIAGRRRHACSGPDARACWMPAALAAAHPARNLPGVAAACEQRNRRGAGSRGAAPQSAPRAACRCMSMRRRAPASCR